MLYQKSLDKTKNMLYTIIIVKGGQPENTVVKMTLLKINLKRGLTLRSFYDKL